MVTVSKVETLFPNLFSEDPVDSLGNLLRQYQGELPVFHDKVMKKAEKGFSEKRYLSWLRHSLAFKLRQTSPQKILESWTLDVIELLGNSWVDSFDQDDEVALAFLGKLGSGELNLSSDVDIIFYGGSSVKLKKVRDYISVISGANSIPYGFKVDLDLRPGGASAPILCSPARLGDHLWNSSDPWERYSYTRMDLQLGNGAVIKEVNEIRDKYCYRKYLSSDFFHSFVNMRKDYHVENTTGQYNVKLGAGGIRDIELFVQTFQILHGGRDLKFRGLSTFELLDLLIRENINRDIFKRLKTNYIVLRQAEGELHALNEQGGFKWIREKSEFDEVLFEAAKSSNLVINQYIQSSKNIFGNTNAVLKPDSFRDRIAKRLSGDEDVRQRALENLDTYFLNKKNQFKSYYGAILSQEKVSNAFVDLLQYSDYGCQVLSRRPSLLDVFFLRKKAAVHESDDAFFNSLSDVKMVQRILASSEFKKTKDTASLGEKVTSSYEMILRELISPKDGVDLLFFGKMASREMGLSSDLDFVMVSEEEEIPLKKAREIYRKMSYLTVFGPLVPYDTDGGPMGKASPLLLTWKSVESFLRDKAEPWQKLMYLRQRRLFSDKEVLYLEGPMDEADISALFEVLREKLRVSSYRKDPYKHGMGGLFHTEFIIGALYLRFGIQPVGSLKIAELLEKLELMTYERDSLRKLASNYDKIASAREEAVVVDHKQEFVQEDILNESFEILEFLSEKFLYSNTVAGV